MPFIEFLDRMSIKGILPLYSNVMLPISRQEVADLLKDVDTQNDKLTGAESEFLTKFKQEFAHELNPSDEQPSVLFKSGDMDGIFSEKEKYLYTYADSSVSLYIEFLGTI